MAAHALVASFLGATTLRDHGLSPLGWVALVALVLGLVAAAILLGPWRLGFAMDARKLFDQLREQAAWEERAHTLDWLAAAGFAHQAVHEEEHTKAPRQARDLASPRVGLAGRSSIGQRVRCVAVRGWIVLCFVLVAGAAMAAKTAGSLGQGLTAGKVSADLSVRAQGESNIVNVAATAGSPALAAPTSPSSLKVSRNTILGAVLGLLLGLGVAYLTARRRSLAT